MSERVEDLRFRMRLSKDREDDEEGVMAVSCGMALVPVFMGDSPENSGGE
jgi:hypothetical protein